jgi:hypothetical protein
MMQNNASVLSLNSDQEQYTIVIDKEEERQNILHRSIKQLNNSTATIKASSIQKILDSQYEAKYNVQA